jgi:predicted permease
VRHRGSPEPGYSNPMKSLRAMLVRSGRLFRRNRHEAEMADELRAHVDALTERNLAAGMSPDEARYTALRAFGGVAQIAERARDERRSAWIEHLLQDVRYAAWQLRKSPGFSTVVVLSLALGIGANTAIFSALDRVLLRPLPVTKPDELVRFQWMAGVKGARPPTTEDDVGRIDPATGRRTGTVFSLATVEAFRAHHPLLKEVFAFTRPPGFTIAIDGETSNADGQVVSGNYYRALGVTAWLGRALLPEDDQPAAPAVAVISFGFWQRRFGSDRAVVGKTILVNRSPVTIVGVMPPDFADPISVFGQPSFTFPFTQLPLLEPGLATKDKPGYWWIRIMGRLQPGATAAQAAASLQPPFEFSAREGLTEKNDPPRLLTTPGGHGLIESRWKNANPLLVLTGMAALVLLAACANVANLLLARGVARRRELAVRLALGAGRSRLIRQLLTESALLASLGAALGLLLAAWGGELLPFVGARGGDIVDLRVFGFATAITFLTGLAFALMPAWRATRLDLTAEFQGGTRQLGRGGRTRLSQTLLIVQVALSLMLLVGAGLFFRTLRNLQGIDIGFRRENLLLFSLNGAPAGYKGAPAAGLYRRIAERIEALPGVRALTFSSTPVLGSIAGLHYRLDVIGRAPTKEGRAARVNQVGANFFETIGIPVVRGRLFDPRDHAAASGVVVVDQTLADQFFPGEDPIGRRIKLNNGEREIVGVVRDVQQATMRALPVPTAYVPYAPGAPGAAHFAVRTAGDPSAIAPAIRAAVKDMERNLPVANVRTQERQIESMVSQERSFARLTTFFGGLALALVCIGLYGLMSYAVVRRTGEIGLRMALGALPGHVLRMVLRESLALVLLGVALGIGGALAAVRLVANLLYGLSPTDAATYSVVTLLLVGVALAAAFIPARRAAKIDPMVALRTE